MDDAPNRSVLSADEVGPALAAAAGGASGRTQARINPLVFQVRVIKALVLRDIAARHGDRRLGPLLSLIMPLMGIGLMMVVFNLRGKLAPDSMNFGVFMATGYPLWIAFRGIYNGVMNSASRNDPLLMFPQITQLDLIIAKVIHEVALETLVFVAICVGVMIFFQAPAPENPMGVMFCFWGCAWIGASLGLVLCALQRALPIAVMVINSFMRLGVWISGVMFTLNRLPDWVWPYLRWNPMLHLIEGARHSWQSNFVAPIFSPAYVILIGFLMTTAGFVFERATRRLVGP